MNPRRYVVCDIEATGLDEDKEIIEIALITYEDGRITDVYETLINPLRSIPEYIKDLTSISTRELSEAPKFYEVAEAIKMRVENSIFVSHNTDFDYHLLRKKFLEMGEVIKLKTFCTFKVAQHEIPGLRSYNLDSLCNFFRIKNTERHRAIGDAKATLELFKELLKLRLKTYTKIMYLPHHEKALKDISTRAGLLSFKDAKGKVLRFEAAFNMEKTAREILMVSPEKRDLLIRTESIVAEPTGMAIIAEYKKLLYQPYQPHWMVVTQELNNGEKIFKVRPYKKGFVGLWYFKDYLDARQKLKDLQFAMKDQTLTFAHREGGKSKEEIVRQNLRVDTLSKEAKFPSEHLIILGEGRTLGEKSFVLVRAGHVLGFGYTNASDEEIWANPDQYINRRFFQHLGINLATQRYIRVLKNMRSKSEGWRSLAEASVVC